MILEIQNAWDEAWKVKQVKNCKVERYHIASDAACQTFEKMCHEDKEGKPLYLHPAFEKEGAEIAAYIILQAHISFNKNIKKPCVTSGPKSKKKR